MVSSNQIKNKKKYSSEIDSSVIRGDFRPNSKLYPEPAILRINNVLGFFLLLSILASMVSYLAVMVKENKIKEVQVFTNKINYENIDMQNKVDYLKSFYIIDNKVSKINFLKKPDKVIEIRANKPIPLIHDNGKKTKITSESGF
jgi:hypothetical protein